MYQLQIHLKNHLQPYSLNYIDQREAKAAFDVILNRRKNKLRDLVELTDDFQCVFCLDCTDVSVHYLANSDETLRISAENAVKSQVYQNKAILREQSKPHIAPASLLDVLG